MSDTISFEKISNFYSEIKKGLGDTAEVLKNKFVELSKLDFQNLVKKDEIMKFIKENETLSIILGVVVIYLFVRIYNAFFGFANKKEEQSFSLKIKEVFVFIGMLTGFMAVIIYSSRLETKSIFNASIFELNKYDLLKSGAIGFGLFFGVMFFILFLLRFFTSFLVNSSFLSLLGLGLYTVLKNQSDYVLLFALLGMSVVFFAYINLYGKLSNISNNLKKVTKVYFSNFFSIALFFLVGTAILSMLSLLVYNVLITIPIQNKDFGEIIRSNPYDNDLIKILGLVFIITWSFSMFSKAFRLFVNIKLNKSLKADHKSASVIPSLPALSYASFMSSLLLSSISGILFALYKNYKTFDNFQNYGFLFLAVVLFFLYLSYVAYDDILIPYNSIYNLRYTDRSFSYASNRISTVYSGFFTSSYVKMFIKLFLSLSIFYLFKADFYKMASLTAVQDIKGNVLEEVFKSTWEIISVFVIYFIMTFIDSLDSAYVVTKFYDSTNKIDKSIKKLSGANNVSTS